jgi:small ligand-binding sensory domain FIST
MGSSRPTGGDQWQGVRVARFGDGLARDADVVRAAERAVAQAISRLHGARPDLICVFIGGDQPDDSGAVAERIRVLCPSATVLGCSAAGVIGAGQGVEADRAVSVWAAALPGVRIRGFHLEVLRSPNGMAVVGMPEGRPEDTAIILLADPYSFPVDGFVEQANNLLVNVPMVGGMAFGPRGPGSTRLLLDDRVSDRGAVGVVLGGPVTVRALVSQGCRPIGPTMVVTKSEGNAILELAGTSALERLEQIVAALDPDDQAMVSAGLQFGVAMDEYAEEHERGAFLIRSVLGVDRDRKAVLVGDLVPVGRTVRFQIRDAETAADDLELLLKDFRNESGLGIVDGVLLVSCSGRGSRLFQGAGHDVDAVREALGTTAVAGFFATGEIGPVAGRNHLHGFSAAILAFGEAR